VLVKTLAVAGALVLVRRRRPALRPDKFVEAAWAVLLPAVLLQDLVVAVVAVGRS
jgi:NADH-quinone oxidoreductase subunit H